MGKYPHYKPDCVLITGASGDFGKAFARRFSALGCKLVLHGRTAKKIEDLQKELGGDTHAIIFDMADKEAMKTAIDTLPDDFQQIDLLINNAGLALGLDKVHEANLEDWEQMVNVDILGLIRMTRFIIEGMVARKKGHIINIGSTAGNYPYMGGNVYGASKAFVKQFSLSVRADLVGTNVRMTNLEPAQVETQFSTVRFKGDEARAKAVYANTKSLMPEDVAEAAVWAATLPAHVNINRMEIMPTMQYPAGLAVERHG